MQATVEVITPMAAKALLEMNTGNFRKLDHHRVKHYANCLRNGEWEENGATIVINGTQLIDGQHRLHAIVASGIPMKTVVVRGADSSGLSVDRGKPRSVAQFLEHLGVKNSRNVATICRSVLAYKAGVWMTDGFSAVDVAATDHATIEFAKQNDARLQSACRLAMHTRKRFPVSIVGTVLMIGSGNCPAEEVELAQWFVRGLETGIDVGPTDAVFHLRNKLLGMSKHVEMTTLMKKALCVIAWNRSVTGEATNARHMTVTLTGPRKQELPSTILVVQ